MAALTEWGRAAMADHFMGVANFPFLAGPMYLGLWITDPTVTGAAGTQVSRTGTAYAWQAVAFDANAAGVSDNTDIESYAKATAEWGLIAYWVLHTPVLQAETAVVTNGSTIGAGNLSLTITSAGMGGSPLALTIAVAGSQSAAQIATAIEAFLGSDGTAAAVAAKFTIGGGAAGSTTLTEKAYTDTDATLAIVLTAAGGTGVTMSASTTTARSYPFLKGQFQTAKQIDIDDTFSIAAGVLDTTWA